MSMTTWSELPEDLKTIMLDRAESQGNSRDEAKEAFIKKGVDCSNNMGGFTWGRTPEGHNFWASILESGVKLEYAMLFWEKNKYLCQNLDPITPIMVTKDNVFVGLRVERGRDWIWDNQDKGEQGTVIEINDDWVKVRWDYQSPTASPNFCFGYRIGNQDIYFDLYVCKDEFEEIEI